MPKFVVRKDQDAWVHYETVVETETPEDARRIARDVMFDGPWFATGDVTEFDHLEIDEETGIRPLEDGETLERIVTLGVTARERNALLTGLRVLQIALEAGHLAPMLADILTDGGAHAVPPLAEIDALCERINV